MSLTNDGANSLDMSTVEVVKECNSNKFVYRELDYMHKNPVSKKWLLVNDFTDYLYSSASYYEKGIKQYHKLLHK